MWINTRHRDSHIETVQTHKERHFIWIRSFSPLEQSANLLDECVTHPLTHTCKHLSADLTPSDTCIHLLAECLLPWPTCRHLPPKCRHLSSTRRHLSSIRRQLSPTCRHLSHTCRHLSPTCKHLSVEYWIPSYICRHLSHTCRQLSHTHVDICHTHMSTPVTHMYTPISWVVHTLTHLHSYATLLSMSCMYSQPQWDLCRWEPVQMEVG